MNSLAHKVALVTEVTRRQGIGAAVALALAQAGADVCMAYYRPYDRMMPWGVEDTEPEQILVALRQTGVRVHGVEIDLGQPEGPRTLFTQVQERFSRIDILVNNAAYSTATSVERLTAADLDQHYAVNLRAVYSSVWSSSGALPKEGQGVLSTSRLGKGYRRFHTSLPMPQRKGALTPSR